MTTHKPTDEERIENILENFNFRNVHKAMFALNWDWEDSLGVPSILEMRNTARGLLEKVGKKPGEFIGTGGFTARRSGKGLSLTFEIEEWETE